MPKRWISSIVLRDAVESLRPAYDDTLVHVDLDDSSRQQLEHFYLNRTQYAQVVHNLTAMHVAAQMHDVIFAEPSNTVDDQALVDATAAAGPIYYLNGARSAPRAPCPNLPCTAHDCGVYILSPANRLAGGGTG